jgi:beta-N-acetylhexosaminidase|tara:strand:- start:1343 stop:2293 length:951 start_codon:yes stop_codon:yes gene_type:complete
MKNRKAFITGISSTYLKKNEIDFLKTKKPWGVILFSRNIINFDQTKILTNQIRSCFHDNKYPILIDEEGGRVSRLKKIIDTSNFSSKFFNDLYLKNKKKFFYHYKIYINNISQILNDLGININTVPVLDVNRNKSNKVLENRSFSNRVKIVSKLGDYCIKFYSKNRIGTVIKHIPGHGLAIKDSHFSTPIVNEKKKILNNIDFLAFKNKKSLFALTAHVIYSQYDPINTATHSKIIINEIIRKKLKFKHLLMSDDISMKALRYSLEENVIRSLNAGCNLILHCNGNIDEMRVIANNVPKIDDFVIKKTSQFYKFLI